jgi:hypothetical protein
LRVTCRSKFRNEEYYSSENLNRHDNQLEHLSHSLTLANVFFQQGTISILEDQRSSAY